MPFNGNGTAENVGRPMYPPQSNEIIYAAYFVTIINDILGMLSNCVTRDGQSPLSDNLPANGKKIVGLAAGTANGDAVAFGQDLTVGNLTFTGSLSTTLTLVSILGSWDFSGGSLLVATQPSGSTGEAAASVDYVGNAVNTAVALAPVVAQSTAALAILNYIGA